MKPESRIYLLHDKGGSPNGTVLQFEAIIHDKFYDRRFERPLLPCASPQVSLVEALDWLVFTYRKEILPESVLVGLGAGGLLAARLQELSPNLNLRVMAIASPVSEDGVSLWEFNAARTALCSGEKQEADWEKHAGAVFNLPMLSPGDLNLCKFALSSLISSFVREEDIYTALVELFPAL